jgi:hypothetical protein
MAMHEQGAAVFVGQVYQGGQGPSHALVAGAEHAVIQKRHDRIDHGEARVGLAEGLVQPAGMGGKAPRRILIVALAMPDEDALRVGAQALQPGNDGIGGGVFGAEDQRVGRAGTGAAIGKRPACAQARAQVEREQRFAQV